MGKANTGSLQTILSYLDMLRLFLAQLDCQKPTKVNAPAAGTRRPKQSAVDRLLNVMRKRGPLTATRLCSLCRSTPVNTRNELLQELINDGRVASESRLTNGRPVRLYRAT